MKTLSEVLASAPAVRGAMIQLAAAKAAKKAAKTAMRNEGETVLVRPTSQSGDRAWYKFVPAQAASARHEQAKAVREAAKADLLAALLNAGMSPKAVKHIAKELLPCAPIESPTTRQKPQTSPAQKSAKQRLASRSAPSNAQRRKRSKDERKPRKGLFLSVLLVWYVSCKLQERYQQSQRKIFKVSFTHPTIER